MPATALFVHHQQTQRLPDSPNDDAPLGLYIIAEHDGRLLFDAPPDHGRPLTAHRCEALETPNPHPPHHHIASTPRSFARPRPPRPLMASLAYPHHVHSAYGPPPGSPPDLTNSKSSKSSSLHSSNLSDLVGPSDLSHFEDINLDEVAGAQDTPKAAPSAGRSLSFSHPYPQPHPHAAHHSFRDLTGQAKPRYPSLKGQVHHVVQRQQSQLAAPGKPLRRGFTSPSAPSLTNMNLAAPARSSRSQSPSNTHKYPSSPRTLSRKSSRNLDVLPSPALSSRRQSWQDSKRKSVQEKEAECDDEDDELPEDAVIWNVPISPRPAQDRSPALSSCGSPLQSSSVPSTGAPSSSKTSPAPSLSRYSPRAPSPNVSSRGASPPTHLSRQPTNTWEDTYTHLDPDAKKLTEALEEFQSEFERKQEVTRQNPGLTRSTSLKEPEPKTKRHTLPPIRKSDPLIDPFQPSAEKQKYLSRTRPSWLPPKNPKEEKKHLKEYQRMLARIEEAERLEAQRVQEEALAREKASRIKAEYWSSLLLPHWDTEMTNPELRASHRKMWWNGIPPRLRGQVWLKAIGNDLEITETTYTIALDKAQREIAQRGTDALSGRYAQIVTLTRSVFPELKMFATAQDEQEQAQALHQDLVNLCLAYTTYRPDISSSSTSSIPHIAALLLLNLSASQAFVALANLLNRPVPLSFLVHDPNSIHAAYSTTLHALARKSHALAQRLETLRVEPRDYLFYMFSSLFCARLGVEHAARVMDVYAIEGDKIMPRVAVAVACMLEGSCVSGGAEVVARVLREKEVQMECDEFMSRVYEAGKSGGL